MGTKERTRNYELVINAFEEAVSDHYKTNKIGMSSYFIKSLNQI